VASMCWLFLDMDSVNTIFSGSSSATQQPERAPRRTVTTSSAAHAVGIFGNVSGRLIARPLHEPLRGARTTLHPNRAKTETVRLFRHRCFDRRQIALTVGD
jgi:hypothetical protein